jgi:5'-nucleotidase
MKRRQFLENILQAGIITVVPSFLGSMVENPYTKAYNKKITILHTNDTHARIDPFPENAGKYAGMGGIARRASLVKQFREQDPDLLLLDSGDIFQGTPYFNFFGGELDLKLMSEMGYDASTIGNHEFDNGLEGFINVVEHAKFPFVVSNYNARGTSWNPHLQAYHIIERKGIKIGIFGLGIELKGLVLPKMYEGIVYRDPVVLAQSMVRSLREYNNCDLVICLSHLGYKYSDPDRVSDSVVAAKVPGIDLILGGHTHTFMDEPDVFTHEDGSKTYIHQVGFGGIRLGKIEVYFDESRKPLSLGHDIISIFGKKEG